MINPAVSDRFSWACSIEGSPIFSRVREEIDDLEVKAMRSLRDDRASDGLIVVSEEKLQDIACRFEYVVGYSEILRDFHKIVLTPIVEAFVGEPVLIFKDKINCKVGGGGEYRAHQDIVAYRHFPPNRFVTAMVAIDEMTVENGCLEFAFDFEIEHLVDIVESMDGFGGVLKHYLEGDQAGDILPEIVKALNWVPVTAKAGDILLFDGYLPHRSAVNSTSQPRRALFITYNPETYGSWYEEYYTRKRLHPDDPIFHVSTPTRRTQSAPVRRIHL